MEKIIDNLVKEYKRQIRGKKEEWLFITLKVDNENEINIKQYNNHIQRIQWKNICKGGAFYDTQKQCIEEVRNTIKYVLENK